MKHLIIPAKNLKAQIAQELGKINDPNTAEGDHLLKAMDAVSDAITHLELAK